MRRDRLKDVALFASALLNVVLAGSMMWALAPQRSPMLSLHGILAIQKNDPCDKVIREIGYPIEVLASDSQRTDPTRQVGPWPKEYEWRYTRDGLWGSFNVSVFLRDCVVASLSVMDRGRPLLDPPFIDEARLKVAFGEP